MEKLKHPDDVTFKVVISKGFCSGHLDATFSIRKDQLGKWSCGGEPGKKMTWGNYGCCNACLGYIRLPWLEKEHGFDTNYVGVCCGVTQPDKWCLEVVK